MFFLPIRDHNPSGGTPWVTYLLLAANLGIFLLTVPYLGDERLATAFFLTWGLVPGDLAAADVLTSMFLHGGLLHLGGNMLFLWLYGDNMEDVFGHLGFLAFYLACGIAAALLHVATVPGSPVPLVGASGAIAGVMGGYLLLFPRARIDILMVILIIVRIVPVPAWAVLALWFGTQVFSGASMPSGGGGVAYWAHVGGFLAGLVLTLPAFLIRGGPRYWTRTHGHPPHPEATYGRTNVPAAGRRRR